MLDPTLQHDILLALLQDPDVAIQQQAMRKFGEARRWDILQPFITDANPHLRKTAIQALSRGAPLPDLLPVIDEVDPSIRRSVVQAAVRDQAWDALWGMLDDADRTLQHTAMAALMTQPSLNADEQTRIEARFTAWDPRTPFGTSTLRDLVTQYERALERSKKS